MRKKGVTTEQIIKKLREAEVLLSKGETAAQIMRKMGISDVAYYRWLLAPVMDGPTYRRNVNPLIGF